MYNFIKSYSSVWSKTIDYTWLFDKRKMSICEVVICMIWIVLYALPLLPYVIFLLKPFPTVNESGEYTLLAVWGSMLVMSICGVFLSTIVIKLFSEKVPRIPSDAYKRHPFIATFIFYTLGISFVFLLIEYLAPLLIETIFIIHDKITTL
ncbi:TPA: hypothetical protein G8W61_004610 [Salmonella enterica]|uniref:Uncharacterized protein n=1 Tax=Salmonella enterica TaxID=28901 RepID=A0A760BHP6_SALER|nr:hypothetical protein [Salmonella enterica]